MDTVSREVRSRIMASIRSVSRLELEARPMLRRMKLGNLRHQPNGIVGRPDFANKKRKMAIYIMGCFFHQPCPEKCCKMPKTNVTFWRNKFKANRHRHEFNKSLLLEMGWIVIEIWEHEIRGRR